MSGIRNGVMATKLGVDAKAAAQQAKQSNKQQVSFGTVYLLTGPMLLGIPARQKQREKHFTAPWRLREDDERRICLSLETGVDWPHGNALAATDAAGVPVFGCC